jgi:hypothetical protein
MKNKHKEVLGIKRRLKLRLNGPQKIENSITRRKLKILTPTDNSKRIKERGRYSYESGSCRRVELQVNRAHPHYLMQMLRISD